MLDKIGLFLQVFYLLRSKFFWIIIIIIIALCFGYAKYGDKIIQNNPQLKEIKEKIDGVKEKSDNVKKTVDSLPKPKAPF